MFTFVCLFGVNPVFMFVQFVSRLKDLSMLKLHIGIGSIWSTLSLLGILTRYPYQDQSIIWAKNMIGNVIWQDNNRPKSTTRYELSVLYIKISLIVSSNNNYLCYLAFSVVQVFQVFCLMKIKQCFLHLSPGCFWPPLNCLYRRVSLHGPMWEPIIFHSRHVPRSVCLGNEVLASWRFPPPRSIEYVKLSQRLLTQWKVWC